MIRKPGGENLRFRFETPKGAGVHDAIAIPGVFVAVRVSRLRKSPAAAVFGPHGPSCESAVRFDREASRKFRLGAGRQVFEERSSSPRSAWSATGVLG